MGTETLCPGGNKTTKIPHASCVQFLKNTLKETLPTQQPFCIESGFLLPILAELKNLWCQPATLWLCVPATELIYDPWPLRNKGWAAFFFVGSLIGRDLVFRLCHARQNRKERKEKSSAFCYGIKKISRDVDQRESSEGVGLTNLKIRDPCDCRQKRRLMFVPGTPGGSQPQLGWLISKKKKKSFPSRWRFSWAKKSVGESILFETDQGKNVDPDGALWWHLRGVDVTIRWWLPRVTSDRARCFVNLSRHAPRSLKIWFCSKSLRDSGRMPRIFSSSSVIVPSLRAARSRGWIHYEVPGPRPRILGRQERKGRPGAPVASEEEKRENENVLRFFQKFQARAIQ